ncbi:MAG: oxidoreductase [Gammaproteobacteria bacterium]|nr:MAG: oxidoreductase [Gammaproteobacteria bacterium]RLA15857.1 MAG: oxidoreductase [Gammaproteobacteria bacterium]
MSHTTQAYRVHQDDDRKISSSFDEMVLESPVAGEVLVKVAYSSVNYKDALACTGAGKIVRGFPRVAGIDLAGTVVESGDDRYAAGDEVVLTGYSHGESLDGGYTQLAKVSADYLVPLPAGISLLEAMSLGTAGFTAALSVHRLQQVDIKPDGGPILVTGATGGVGSIAIDLLAGQGYEVAAFTGKVDQTDYLKSLGASQVVNRHELELGSRPLEKGLWGGAVDTVGDETLAWLTRTVNPWGAIASCGLAGGITLNTTVMPFIIRGITLLGIDSVLCPMPIREQVWARLAGDLKPRNLETIANVVDFEQLPAQFDQFLKGTIKGRIVVKIGD